MPDLGRQFEPSHDQSLAHEAVQDGQTLDFLIATHLQKLEVRVVLENLLGVSILGQGDELAILEVNLVLYQLLLQSLVGVATNKFIILVF